jgi:outer membrane protein assembly factor BamA
MITGRRTYARLAVLLLIAGLILPPAGRCSHEPPDTTAIQPVLPDSAFRVDHIVITGNANTKDFVITRELSLHPGDFITREAIDYDRNRIYSLGLFNRVHIEVTPSGEGIAIVTIAVSERWFIYPYPILGIKDRDWKKVYYGAGLIHMNFRGRNEKLIGSFGLGFDPWVALMYRNPFLSSDGSTFLEARIVYSSARNRSLKAQVGGENFDEKQFVAGITAGRRWGNDNSGWLSLSYESIDISDYSVPPTVNDNGKDRYPVLGAGYSYDTRDLAEYPNMGTLVRLGITKYGVTAPGLNITRYSADVRRFSPVSSRVVLAGRAFTNLVSGGEVPSYKRVYFGYDQRIRGHFKEVLEGEDIFGVTTEVHYAILSPVYFTADFLPSEFGVWKFGVSAAIFADAGTVWDRSDSFALDRFVGGYGGGIHILLPYSIVLRIEYAFDESRTGQFILDVSSAL